MSTPARPTTDEPTVEQLVEWADVDGGCEVTDGCWVEADGECDHGHVSWQRYWGLI